MLLLHNNKYHFMNSLAFLHVRVELEWIIGEFFYIFQNIGSKFN